MDSTSPLASGSASAAPHTVHPASDFGGLSDHLDYWRSHLNQYKHPVVLFDGNIWPILLNQTFQQLVLDVSPVVGTTETVSSIWKSACETAADVVKRHSEAGSKCEVTELFRLNQRCFLVLGSLLRSPSGRLAGAVINIAEFNSSATDRDPAFGNRIAGSLPVGVDKSTGHPEEEFQHWLACREMAREKLAVLSKRESQVLAFVADGQTNKRIAVELGVTTKTVEKHRANAALKLGAGSSAELVRISVFAGHDLEHSLPASRN